MPFLIETTSSISIRVQGLIMRWTVLLKQFLFYHRIFLSLQDISLLDNKPPKFCLWRYRTVFSFAVERLMGGQNIKKGITSQALVIPRPPENHSSATYWVHCLLLGASVEEVRSDHIWRCLEGSESWSRWGPTTEPEGKVKKLGD